MHPNVKMERGMLRGRKDKETTMRRRWRVRVNERNGVGQLSRSMGQILHGSIT